MGEDHMVNQIDLRAMFLGLQEQMLTKAKTNASTITHPSTAGDATELNWQEMLDVYLPKRYQVTKGFVVDCRGQVSEQQDLIIFDRHYSPFIFNQNGAAYVPAESVYGVFEVKPSLNKEHVEYAGNKAASVRALLRTSTSIPHAGGVYSGKQLHEILGGLLVTKSGWNPPLGEPFKSCLAALPLSQRLNLGASLSDGGFAVAYKNGGVERIETSDAETALMFFFLRLLTALQDIGTVPAIDFTEYGKSL